MFLTNIFAPKPSFPYPNLSFSEEGVFLAIINKSSKFERYCISKVQYSKGNDCIKNIAIQTNSIVIILEKLHFSFKKTIA
ncbi:hypothetical protein COM62_30440 [Bacillus pseudomycoides]|nr:hypothetical protein COM62_30440 [Bacillus pseudomycoides]